MKKISMKWILNLKDESGNIRTGYQEVLEGTKEEVLMDYLYFLNIVEGREHTPEEITEKDISLEVDFEEVKQND